MVGIGAEDNRQLVRLVEVLYGDKWYRYLSNELDAERLLSAYLVALYCNAGGSKTLTQSSNACWV